MSDEPRFGYVPEWNGRSIKVKAVVGDRTVHLDALERPAKAEHREQWVEKFTSAVQEKVPVLDPDDAKRLAEELRNTLQEMAAQGPPTKASSDQGRARTSMDEAFEKRDRRGDELLKAQSEEAREAAETMLADPHLIDLVVEDLHAMGVVGEEILALSVYLLGTSRLITTATPDRPRARTSRYSPASTGRSAPPGLAPTPRPASRCLRSSPY